MARAVRPLQQPTLSPPPVSQPIVASHAPLESGGALVSSFHSVGAARRGVSEARIQGVYADRASAEREKPEDYNDLFGMPVSFYVEEHKVR